MQHEKEAREGTATEAMIAHKCQLQRVLVLEMERLNKESRIRPIIIKDQNSCNVAKTPRIPAFDENQMRWIRIYFALRGMLLLRVRREINGLPI